jgi:hypothetical protein
MNRLFSSITVLLILLAFPSAGSPTPQATQKPGAKEVRPTISLTKDGLIINGTRVQLGRTTKADLEKLLGPLERTLKLEIRRDPVGFWDTKGLRIYFLKDTGVVDYFDCVLVVGEFPALDPKQPFRSGTARVALSWPSPHGIPLLCVIALPWHADRPRRLSGCRGRSERLCGASRHQQRPFSPGRDALGHQDVDFEPVVVQEGGEFGVGVNVGAMLPFLHCPLQSPNSDGRTKWPRRQRTGSLTK